MLVSPMAQVNHQRDGHLAPFLTAHSLRKENPRQSCRLGRAASDGANVAPVLAFALERAWPTGIPNHGRSALSVRPQPRRAARAGVRFAEVSASRLSVNASKLQRERDAIDREHVGSDAVVHTVGFGVADDFAETMHHHVLQALVHFAFPPEQALAVLDPLEVADGDATGVRTNVRKNEDVFFPQNFISGIAPTGKQFTTSGVSIARFAGGKMVEGWVNWDALGLMQQLGVVPELAKAKATAR
jgi:hypothetical protein